MDGRESGAQLRIAAGCSLACPFCAQNGGRDGPTLEALLCGAAPLPSATGVVVTAGDLVHPRMVPLVDRLRRGGADRVSLYAHAHPVVEALPDLASAGTTGLHLVLPAAAREDLARLTGGRGSLARTAALLDRAAALGLAIALEIPVVEANVAGIPDTVRRVLRRGGRLESVTLRFLSESGPRGRLRWDPAPAAGPVAEAAALCQEAGVPFGLAVPEAPPPCLLPVDLPPASWGDLAARAGPAPAKRPFDACGSCAAGSICRFDARHLLPAVPPRPLAPSDGSGWVGAASVWVRRDGLSALREAVSRRGLACLNPWTQLETHSVKGTVISCATHYFRMETQEACASWHGSTIRDAWNSEGMRAIRRSMAAGRPRETCSPDCPRFHGKGAEDGWRTSDPVGEPFYRNLVHNLQEIADGAEVLESWPQHLVIAPSLRCNIECVMCRFPVEVRASQDRRRVDLTDAQFDEVISLFPYLRVLNITGGEPLVARRTRELLRRFNAREFPDGGIVLTTNGLLLGGDVVEDLRGSRLLNVIVSLNAASPKTYEHVTGVDGFDRVVGNVRALIQAGPTFPTPPRVTLSYVVMRSTWRELPAFLDLAASLRASIQLLPIVGELGGECLFTEPALLQEVDAFLRDRVAPAADRWPAAYRRELGLLTSTLSRRVDAADYRPL